MADLIGFCYYQVVKSFSSSMKGKKRLLVFFKKKNTCGFMCCVSECIKELINKQTRRSEQITNSKVNSWNSSIKVKWIFT